MDLVCLEVRAQLRLDWGRKIVFQKLFDTLVGNLAHAMVHVRLDKVHFLPHLVEFGGNVATRGKRHQATLKIP
jgi:hypothetical protein